LLVGSGVVQAVSWTGFFTAFKLTGVANAVLLLYTAPIFVALLAPYLLSERREPRAYVSLLLAATGTVLIFRTAGIGEHPEVLGILSGLLAGFLFALLIMADRKLSQSQPSEVIVAVQLLVASLILAPAPLLEHRLPSYYEISLLLMLGLVHTGFALNLYLDGLSSTPAQHAVIIQYLEPASAILYAAIFLSEIPGLTSLIGGILIIAANLILAANRKQYEETSDHVKNDRVSPGASPRPIDHRPQSDSDRTFYSGVVRVGP
jgi:drug/metabolite transporter (DMT)-like permease